MRSKALTLGCRSAKGNFVSSKTTSLDVDTTSRDVQALDTFVLSTIPKKHTLFGAKHKLAIVVRAKIRPAGTSKHTRRFIIWFCVEKSFYGSFIVDNSARKHVDDVDGSEKRFVPKF